MGSFKTDFSTIRSKTSTPFRSYLIFLLSACIFTLSPPGAVSLDVDVIIQAFDRVAYAIIPLPSDPKKRALALLNRFPIIDGHIDLPILARWKYKNQIIDIDLDSPTQGEVDIPRLRQGRVGGFFSSVYVPCGKDVGIPAGDRGNFTVPTYRVRDTMEQIDIAKLMIQKFSRTFELVSSAKEWRTAMRKKKVGSMLGVEGGHQLGTTLATIRLYYELGVRYITLTHTCNNALADSCGAQDQEPPVEARWGGLSPFGEIAIKEMNRLGMMVDLSHTSPATASQALSRSLAPPLFSHSNARGLHDVVRNVPDTILRRIGRLSNSTPYDPSLDGELGLGWGNDTNEAQLEIPSGDTIIMLNFSPTFVSEWDDGSGVRADVARMADHADYIGKLSGREHVGIGSDFDGIPSTPEGLEDVSKYPNLIEELIRRGWSDGEIAGIASENLLRILQKVEAVAEKLRRAGALPETAIFAGRPDL